MTLYRQILYPALLAMAVVAGGCGDQKKMEEQEPEKTSPAAQPSEPADQGDMGPTPAQKVVLEWEEFTNQLAQYTATQRDEAAATIDQQMQKMDARINQVEQQVANMGEEVNQEVKQQRQQLLDTIKQNRTELTNWTKEVRTDSGKAWDEVVKGFSSAYGTLAESLNRAEKEFEDDEAPENQQGEQQKEGA